MRRSVSLHKSHAIAKMAGNEWQEVGGIAFAIHVFPAFFLP
jgi:hypothetical protein